MKKIFFLFSILFSVLLRAQSGQNIIVPYGSYLTGDKSYYYNPSKIDPNYLGAKLVNITCDSLFLNGVKMNTSGGSGATGPTGAAGATGSAGATGATGATGAAYSPGTATISVSAGAVTFNANSNVLQRDSLSSNATSFTVSFSNFSVGAQLSVDYYKTTASNCAITFPANTLISAADGMLVSGSFPSAQTVTAVSTTSGQFEITVIRVDPNTKPKYKVYISQDVP